MKKQKQNLTDEINFTLQKLDGKCAFCGKNRGTIPIEDGETMREIYICGSCDSLMNWEYPFEVEQIDDDKRHNL